MTGDADRRIEAYKRKLENARRAGTFKSWPPGFFVDGERIAKRGRRPDGELAHFQLCFEESETSYPEQNPEQLQANRLRDAKRCGDIRGVGHALQDLALLRGKDAQSRPIYRDGMQWLQERTGEGNPETAKEARRAIREIKKSISRGEAERDSGRGNSLHKRRRTAVRRYRKLYPRVKKALPHLKPYIDGARLLSLAQRRDRLEEIAIDSKLKFDEITYLVYLITGSLWDGNLTHRYLERRDRLSRYRPSETTERLVALELECGQAFVRGARQISRRERAKNRKASAR